eukprot:4235829-Amphidinium_carterae.1
MRGGQHVVGDLIFVNLAGDERHALLLAQKLTFRQGDTLCLNDHFGRTFETGDVLHTQLTQGHVLEEIVGDWMRMPAAVMYSQLCPKGMEALLCVASRKSILADIDAVMIHLRMSHNIRLHGI